MQFSTVHLFLLCLIVYYIYSSRIEFDHFTAETPKHFIAQMLIKAYQLTSESFYQYNLGLRKFTDQQHLYSMEMYLKLRKLDETNQLTIENVIQLL